MFSENFSVSPRLSAWSSAICRCRPASMLMCSVSRSTSMNRWIDALRTPVSRVGDHDHARVDVRAAVALGVRGDRQLEQVDDRLRVLPHRPGLDDLRLDRLVVRVVLPLLDLAGDVRGELLLLRADQLREQLTRPVQAGEHRVLVPAHVLEQHGLRAALEMGRDAGQLVHRVDLGTHPDQLPGLVQRLDDDAKVVQWAHRHVLVLSPPTDQVRLDVEVVEHPTERCGR